MESGSSQTSSAFPNLPVEKIEGKNNSSLLNLDESHFPVLPIFNKIMLHKKAEGTLLADKSILICGRFLSHTTLTKYTFPACNFHIFIPETNTLYSTVMNSDECFSGSLKWNNNFFRQIRTSFCTSNSAKHVNKYYFTIANKSENGEDILQNSTQKYLELHLKIGDKMIVAVVLLLKEIVVSNPLNFFLEKCVEVDAELTKNCADALRHSFSKDNEIRMLKQDIQNIEDNARKNQKELITKFHYLNKEKKLKIKEHKG